VSDIIVDMLQIEKPSSSEAMTVKQLRSYQIKKNLVGSFMSGIAASVPQNYGTHIVQHTDTLAGLSLRYGCSTEELRRINHLPTQSIHERSVLKVPPSSNQVENVTEASQLTETMEELMKKRLAARLVKENPPCVFSEAVYYLELADYNFEEAVKDYQEDASWSKSNSSSATTSNPKSKPKRKSNKGIFSLC